MKKVNLLFLFLVPFVILIFLNSISNAAPIVYDNASDYTNAVGAQLFLIDFNGSPGGGAYVDGNTISPYAVFGSPEASNPSEVLWNDNALTDAGSTVAINNVGPLSIEFASVLNAFSLVFSSASEEETVELYDASNSLIDSLLAPNASGFFGVLSDTTIASVIIRNGIFSGGGNDRFFIDNLQGNAPVPEPATMLLLGSGLVGLAGFRRKFKKR